MAKPIDEITAVMLYYGRRIVAEEAVESFLRQTYPHKHLLIINTHPDPIWFEKEYPDVEVHNIIPDTFGNLNAKYNYALANVKTNWWAPWDSDDIWLPWHFKNLAENIPKMRKSRHPRKLGVPRSYFSQDNKILLIGWQMWGDCIFETLDKDGNLYAVCDENDTDNCDRQLTLNKMWNRHWLRPAEYPLSFIFRWHPKGHASLVKDDRSKKYHASLREKMYAIRNKEPFRPHWERDYVKDVEEFLKKKPLPQTTKYAINYYEVLQPNSKE